MEMTARATKRVLLIGCLSFLASVSSANARCSQDEGGQRNYCWTAAEADNKALKEFKARCSELDRQKAKLETEFFNEASGKNGQPGVGKRAMELNSKLEEIRARYKSQCSSPPPG